MNIRSTVTLACFAATCACATGQQPPPITLPVRQVTLFTSGVALTERSGAVEGSATVPLTFNTAQISDILKSLVLLDKGGKVQPATYAARDPVGRTLHGFAVDVSEDLSQAQLLEKLRGADVAIETAGKPDLSGQIVGVEERQTGGDAAKPITATYLNMLTDSGLTSVKLDETHTVRIRDARLSSELHKALSTLATGNDTQRRQVNLHFSGSGRRQVSVAYVTESPIWKISYRLLLGDGAGKSPYLQGWALVDNTTDEDWKNVKLTLVSGRPVSFIQDLYQPLYIPRPEVGPDIVASPYPQTHDENLEQAKKSPAAVAAHEPIARRPNVSQRGLLPAGIEPNDLTALSNNNVINVRYKDDVDGEAAFREVQAGARGARAGEMFQYNIVAPINLPHQQAAMIPVISHDIAADRLSIYNADLDGRYAMNAVRIRNNTSLHLKGGPITLFDGGTYAGDAKMEDVPPGDSRLVSYAVDLSTLCSRESPVRSAGRTTITVHRGVLTQTTFRRNETVYTLKSRGTKERVVLVEHPYDPQSHLISPAAADERTTDAYRFRVLVPAGKTQALRVVTQKPEYSTVTFANLKNDGIYQYIQYGAISAHLKAQLEEVVRRRTAIDTLTAQAAARTNDITAINDDQERIRKNMEQLAKDSALYKRYVAKLDEQETAIGALRQEAAHLQRQAANAAQALKGYIDNISE